MSQSIAIRVAPDGHAIAEPAPEVLDCPRCGGSGKLLVEEARNTFVRSCDCSAVRAGCARFTRARIPGVLADRTLRERSQRDKGPETYGTWDDSQKRALAVMRRFVSTYGTEAFEGRGVCLMGPPGVGKSHLLAGVLRELTLERGVEARYQEFFHLLSDLKDGYAQGRSEMSLIAPLVEIEILAIDELGKGRGTDWEMYVLDELISRRYNAGRVTLFATNYTAHKDSTLQSRLAAGRGAVRTGHKAFRDEMVAETLEERVGSRIWSRLNEMCELVEVQGADYRRENLQAATAVRTGGDRFR